MQTGLYPIGVLQVLKTPTCEKDPLYFFIKQVRVKGPLFINSTFSVKGPLFHQKVHFYKLKEPTQMKVWLRAW